MFPQELQEYITHGREETHIEYKASMKWAKKCRRKEDKVANLKIAKAMLAMSNNPNGGVIVIGEKEKGNGEFRPIGVNKKNYDSFKYDDISRYVKAISSPQVQFKVTRDTMEIDGKERRFVVIQVLESSEFPVICIKMEKYDDLKDAYGGNLLLRENAIYIRSKAPIESREISSVQEWQELIYRIIEKSKRELLKRMPCFDYFREKEKKRKIKKVVEKKILRETAKFERQRRKDNL